jgi:FAD/FMN-containing dehydrogenase
MTDIPLAAAPAAPLADCDPAFLGLLEALLPPGCLRPTEPRDLEEPRGRWQGRAGAVALPRRVEEVQTIVRACAAARVGLVPWGGGTGLVGGQIKPDGALALLLSLERMSAVRGTFAEENVLVAEAGLTLGAVQEHARAAGRIFPLSIASEGSARLGGVLATNAGGVNVLRYGNARDLCLGIEAVLADGTVLHGLKRLRKDNAGYDLRHLLIGSEGTLGIITAASLRLFPAPAAQAVALLVVGGPAAALALLGLAETRLPGLVSAFELISGTGMQFLAETMPDLRQPFSTPPAWSVLIELGLPAALDAEAAMAGLIEAAMQAGLVDDGVVAATPGQRQGLWALREAIPQANRRIGAVSSHDISVPLGAVAEFIETADAALARLGNWRINCFGHLGDGNLHYNVFPARGRTRADHETQREAVKSCVHDIVHRLEGSVSAEHGVGRLKTADLRRYGDPAKLAAMRAIKTALDPLGILNPGAVLD